MKTSRGYTLIEICMVILVLGVIVVVMSGFYSTLFRVPLEIVVKNKANSLASAALEAIKSRAWEEPSGANPLGLDPGEKADDKKTFDDVDDFNGYTESPPRYADGTVMTGMPGYSVKTDVCYVDSDLNVSAAATDRKRITVTVSKKNAKKIVLHTILSRKGGL